MICCAFYVGIATALPRNDICNQSDIKARGVRRGLL